MTDRSLSTLARLARARALPALPLHRVLGPLVACGLVVLVGPALSLPVAAEDDTGRLMEAFRSTVLGAELMVNETTNATPVKRYDGPVRFFIHWNTKENVATDVGRIIEDIASSIRWLDLREAHSEAEANMVLYLVDSNRRKAIDRQIGTIAGVQELRHYVEHQSCYFYFTTNGDWSMRLNRIVVPADRGHGVLSHCLYEEILQSLGATNDDDRFDESLFNDNTAYTYFPRFDRILMNALYDPRIRPGMTAREVDRVLPRVIGDACARVPTDSD